MWDAATAWLDERCIGPFPGSKPTNPGRWSRMHKLNHYATQLAPAILLIHAIHALWYVFKDCFMPCLLCYAILVYLISLEECLFFYPQIDFMIHFIIWSVENSDLGHTGWCVCVVWCVCVTPLNIFPLWTRELAVSLVSSHPKSRPGSGVTLSDLFLLTPGFKPAPHHHWKIATHLPIFSQGFSLTSLLNTELGGV